MWKNVLQFLFYMTLTLLEGYIPSCLFILRVEQGGSYFNFATNLMYQYVRKQKYQFLEMFSSEYNGIFIDLQSLAVCHFLDVFFWHALCSSHVLLVPLQLNTRCSQVLSHGSRPGQGLAFQDAQEIELRLACGWALGVLLAPRPERTPIKCLDLKCLLPCTKDHDVTPGSLSVGHFDKVSSNLSDL